MLLLLVQNLNLLDGLSPHVRIDLNARLPNVSLHQEWPLIKDKELEWPALERNAALALAYIERYIRPPGRLLPTIRVNRIEASFRIPVPPRHYLKLDEILALKRVSTTYDRHSGWVQDR